MQKIIHVGNQEKFESCCRRSKSSCCSRYVANFCYFIRDLLLGKAYNNVIISACLIEEENSSLTPGVAGGTLPSQCEFAGVFNLSKLSPTSYIAVVLLNSGNKTFLQRIPPLILENSVQSQFLFFFSVNKHPLLKRW